MKHAMTDAWHDRRELGRKLPPKLKEIWGIWSRCVVIQQKTERLVPFEITDVFRELLLAWFEKRGRRSDDWVFPSRSNRDAHLTTRQYGRLTDMWTTMTGRKSGVS